MVPLWMLCSWFCMQQVNDHWSHQRANTDFSLTKVLGVRYGLYKFILPFLFYFTFFEMLQLHARSNNHETAWWILKIFEGGLWLMLIYFFSELRAKFLSEYPGRSQCPNNYYISMVLSLCCFPCMIAEMGQCVESKNFSNQATNHDFNNIVWPLDLNRPSNIPGSLGRWTGVNGHSNCPHLHLK